MILNKSLKQFLRESNQPEKKCSKLPTQKLILSEKFRKLLNVMLEYGQSNISKRLLELEKDSDKLFDYSYIDLDDKCQVTFLTSQRIDRLKSEGKPEEEFWTSRLRQPRELRRFISQTLSSFNQESVEKFDKKFKALFNEAGEESNFEMVEGEDIIYWYNYKNYENNNGTLGGSCMAGRESSKFLNCYAFNPNQCKMLILKSKNGNKIRGRALVWKLTLPEDKIFMDRVYINDMQDEMLFTNYARKQGWMYKDKQKYGETDWVYKGEKKVIKAHVVLENTNYDLYPYVDTLRYFYPTEKVMANYFAFKGSDYLTLTDTEGHYDEWVNEDQDDDFDYDPMVFDGYNNVEIPEGRAVWCKYDNAYCHSADAVRLSYNNTYAFPKSPNIVWSTYTSKFYAKEDCEFSKPLNTWIWKKYLVDVYYNKSKTKKDRIHRFELNKTIGKVGEDYYDLDLLKVKDKKIDKDGKDKTEVIYDFKS